MINNKFNVKAWLTRMEAWRERMQPVSQDLIDTQIREQKVRYVFVKLQLTTSGLRVLM